MGPSTQNAIDTLLALTASSKACGPAGAVRAPMGEVGLEDHRKFPSLVDADGWQCISAARLQEAEKDLGSAWRDSVKAAKAKPAPQAKTVPPVWGRKKKQGKREADREPEEDWPYTDYECRHIAGEHRARQRVQYSRYGPGSSHRVGGATDVLSG